MSLICFDYYHKMLFNFYLRNFNDSLTSLVKWILDNHYLHLLKDLQNQFIVLQIRLIYLDKHSSQIIPEQSLQNNYCLHQHNYCYYFIWLYLIWQIIWENLSINHSSIYFFLKNEKRNIESLRTGKKKKFFLFFKCFNKNIYVYIYFLFQVIFLFISIKNKKQ